MQTWLLGIREYRGIIHGWYKDNGKKWKLLHHSWSGAIIISIHQHQEAPVFMSVVRSVFDQQLSRQHAS